MDDTIQTHPAFAPPFIPTLTSTSQCWSQRGLRRAPVFCRSVNARVRNKTLVQRQPCAIALDELAIAFEDTVDDDALASKAESSESFFSDKNFASLGLNIEIVEALGESSITKPTGIQSRGIPPILGGADVIIGAATGSGKTLTYLLPVVQMLKQAEMMREVNDAPLRVARRPRAIVVVPTRELAEQVVWVAKQLSYLVKFRVLGAIGGGSGMYRKLKDKLGAAPVDVLVGTTGRLLQLLDERAVDLRFTTHIVVDEVDTMFDAGFGPELKRVLRAARGRRSEDVNKPQYIAVGATHPRAAEEVYAEEFPVAKRIDVDLHRPPPGLQQKFIAVNANTKLQELVPLLGEARRDGSLRGGRMIVFCNTIDSCRFLGHYLEESGYTTSCVHGEIPPARRDEAYAAFKGSETQLLVCTDMAARGLDNLSVDHVILFDFPSSAVDYLHRAGRTARAGAKGRVTSFVLKKDLRLARAIEQAATVKEDALESARKAREEEKRRKIREEAANRENERQKAEQDDGMEDVPFSVGNRSTRGGEGRGRRGRGNFRGGFSRSSRGSSRGRGGRGGRGRGRGRGMGRSS